MSDAQRKQWEARSWPLYPMSMGELNKMKMAGLGLDCASELINLF